jgi:hypothetical protein
LDKLPNIDKKEEKEEIIESHDEAENFMEEIKMDELMNA